MARSLIKKPRVIIADEPTGNLDLGNSENIMNLLKDLSKDHLVIIVTHNERLAKAYGERTIEIKDGVITSDTNPVQSSNEEKPIVPTVEGISTFFRFLYPRYLPPLIQVVSSGITICVTVLSLF